MDIKAFPDLIDINPKDYRELAFITDFYSRRSGIAINVDSIELTREMYARAYSWIYNEQGRFEGAEAQITTANGVMLPHYLDFQDATIGLDSITCQLKARKSFGQFFEDADNLIWKVVRDKGFLPDSLKIDVPYIIVPDDLIQQQAFVIGQVLALSYQLYMAVFEISKSVAAFADITPTGLIVAIAQLAALIIFFALTVVALIQALNDMKELFFPTLRYFKAFRDYDLINEACKALGYTLESDLLETELYNLCTLGRPEAQANFNITNFTQNQLTNYFNEGYPTAQDSVRTLGELITFIETTYNARTLVYDGVVKIEKRSTYIDTAIVTIVPTLTDQADHDDTYVFHTQEDWGRSYDHWQVDFSDVHSPDQEDGMRSEHITQQINTLNEDLVRLTKLKENSAPFAMGGRKNGYTQIEYFMQAVFGEFEQVILGALGQPPNTTISDRKGVLIIEKQYFSITKKLWLNVDADGIGKQPADYKDYLSMDNIYDNYKTDLEVKTNNRIIKEMTVPLTDSQYTALQLNNFAYYDELGDGNPQSIVELMNVEYFDKKYQANIRILLTDTSAFNTKTVKLA